MMEFEAFEIFLPLALILILSKLLGLVSKKITLPAVVGMLIAGILIGLVQLIPGVEENGTGAGGFIYHALFCDEAKAIYQTLAKIGVVLIMFSAGLGTNLKQIRATGAASVVITLLGVIVPMALGFGVAVLFDYFSDIALLPDAEGAKGSVNLLSDLFYGAILTATSVSITVATLKELDKLNTKEGASIVSAAVLDDVVGIIILSVLTGLNPSATATETTGVTWFTPNAILVAVKILLFFLFAIVMGILARKLFAWMDKRYPHHRRLPIFSIAFAFLYAYLAEKIFGVAEITGAYLAGVMLCGMHDSDYSEKKADSLGYLIFTPVFFANIGISSFRFDAFKGIWIAFGLCYIAVGLLGKLIGCGAGGLITGFGRKDSAKIGFGMMVRAEVILVCAQTGENAGLVSSNIITYVCFIIIISSLLAPLFIKMLYKEEKPSNIPVENQI